MSAASTLFQQSAALPTAFRPTPSSTAADIRATTRRTSMIASSACALCSAQSTSSRRGKPTAPTSPLSTAFRRLHRPMSTRLSHDSPIGVFTADCVPILLCEPKSGLIAAVHAGWKGSVKGIVANAIETMVDEGADRCGIEAVVGASICQRCFEVGDEVVAEFAKRAFSLNDIVWRNPVTGKAHIDLAEANRWLMESAGVPNANISLSGLCTKCEPQRFFSARTLGINSGRILSAIIRRQ